MILKCFWSNYEGRSSWYINAKIKNGGMFFCMCNVLWTNEINILSLNKWKILLQKLYVFSYLCSLPSIVHNLHDDTMIPTEMITDHLFTEVLLFKTNHQMSFQIVHIYMHACMHKSLYQHMKLWTKSSKHVSLQLVLEHGWRNIKLWLIFHIHPGNMVRHLNNLLTFVHTAVTFRQWTWTKVGIQITKEKHSFTNTFDSEEVIHQRLC